MLIYKKNILTPENMGINIFENSTRQQVKEIKN